MRNRCGLGGCLFLGSLSLSSLAALPALALASHNGAAASLALAAGASLPRLAVQSG